MAFIVPVILPALRFWLNSNHTAIMAVVIRENSLYQTPSNFIKRSRKALYLIENIWPVDLICKKLSRSTDYSGHRQIRVRTFTPFLSQDGFKFSSNGDMQIVIKKQNNVLLNLPWGYQSLFKFLDVIIYLVFSDDKSMGLPVRINAPQN